MTGLAAYLDARRAVLGLSVRQLADTAGLPPQYVANVVYGRTRRFPTPDELKALATALQVTPLDLLIAAGYLSE